MSEEQSEYESDSPEDDVMMSIITTPDPSMLPDPVCVEPMGLKIPINKLLNINQSGVIVAYSNQSNWEATINYQLELARIHIRLAERRFKKAEASTFFRLKQEWFQKVGSKATDTFVNKLLVLDTEVEEAFNNIIAWKRVEASLSAAALGMSRRASILALWSADMRLDRKNLSQ